MPVIELADEVAVTVEDVDTGTQDRTPTLHLVATRHGMELWRAALPGMEPDPTSFASNINTSDYVAYEWRAAGLLAIAGEARAYLVNVANGTVRGELSLELTGVSSLDFVRIEELDGSDVLVIASPKRAWLVAKSGQVNGPYRFDGPIESVVAGGASGQVVFRVYDVGDPALPVVDHVLELRLSAPASASTPGRATD